jgi:hypothetical protein
MRDRHERNSLVCIELVCYRCMRRLMMRTMAWIFGALLLLSGAQAGAAVLCQKRSGALSVRTACKKKEAVVDPIALGLRGPKGDQGDPGSPGPTLAISGFKNGPVAVPSSLTSIAQLSIPTPGKYVIVAKLWLFDNVNTSLLTDCQLAAGVDTDRARTMLEGNSGTVVAGTAVALNVVHEFMSPGTVQLSCDAFGVDVSANDIKITAIQVGDLTNTSLP